MARPRKFDDERVIDAAGEVFARLGYGATTMDDLVRATGVGKQSLYNAFGGKRGILLRALSRSGTGAVEAADRALAGQDATPLGLIRAQMLRVAAALSSADRPESLLTAATVELGYRDTEVADSAHDALTRLAETYRECLARAQRSGEISAAADVSALATYFVAVTRGMEVLACAGVGPEALTATAVASLEALPLTAGAADF